MAHVRIRHEILQSGINALFSSTSPTAKDLMRRAIRVQSRARENLEGPPRRIDTGRLRASISIGESPGKKLGLRVGTNVEYAMFVHEGTRYMEANPFLRNALIVVRR